MYIVYQILNARVFNRVYEKKVPVQNSAKPLVTKKENSTIKNEPVSVIQI